MSKMQKNKITKHTENPNNRNPYAFDKVIVGNIGPPLPKSDNGNESSVTFICNLTKYLVAIPILYKIASR